ncbi:P2Y purinoceptor 2 isoform X2 [Gadus morhua]|uniref:P2Y purinoceptor 2 isoform X2 n=1 Tax=Gadus morhua TaxID=8049 RepID=UPI0011B795EA|nr:P2Y purinoceptor 2-like isoform X2 [Gadus morhua]XP_030235856.1 P2Y purinoceptor 2-like isoform X2 [Gadus morhua]
MSIRRGGFQAPAADHHLLFILLIRPLPERHGASPHHVPHKALDPVHHLHAQPHHVRLPLRLHASLPHLLLRGCQRLALWRARLQNRSILFLSVISLHRFIGICYPVRSLSWLSIRRAKLVSVGVWACVLSGQAPVLYYSSTRKYREGFFCVGTTGPEVYYELLVYSSVISVVMFAVPFMVVMVCYGLMVCKLLGPSWGSGERQQGLRAAHRTKQKSVRMIIIVLMTFMFCFLPFHLTRSLFYSFRYLRDKHPEQITCELLEGSSIAYVLTRVMASANSLFNPILYFIAFRDFRKTTKKHKKPGNGLPGCANTALMTSL